MQFGAFCQSKKSIKFSFRLTNLLLLQRLLKIFNHRQCGLTHIVLSKKKKKKIELRSICVLLIKTFIQKLYILSSILYKIPQKAPFIFFSIYTILEKLSHNTGLPIKKERSIFFKSTYGSNYVAFSDMSRNFRSRYHTILTILLFEELYISLDQKLFFLLQICLKNTNQKQYGLTHNYPFTKT